MKYWDEFHGASSISFSEALGHYIHVRLRKFLEGIHGLWLEAWRLRQMDLT